MMFLNLSQKYIVIKKDNDSKLLAVPLILRKAIASLLTYKIDLNDSSLFIELDYVNYDFIVTNL